LSYTLGQKQLDKIEDILTQDLIDNGVRCVFLIDMAGNIIANLDNGEKQHDIYSLAALAAGPNQWNAFLKTQQSPGLAGMHAVMLIYFLVFMTFDWFKLAPKAMAVQAGGKKVPDRVIVIAHYAAWAVISLFVFWLAGVL